MLSSSNIKALISTLEKKNGLSGSIDNNTIDLGRDDTDITLSQNVTFNGPITGLSTLNISGVSTFNNDVRLTNIYSLTTASNINDSGNNYSINIIANKINIGNDFSEVKINGTSTYVFTNEIVAEDPLISLNYTGVTALGARSSGFETYSAGSVVGYLKTTPTQDKYWIKAENTTTLFVATTDLDNNFTVASRLNVSGSTTLYSNATASSTLTTTNGITNMSWLNVGGISTINNTLNAQEIKQQYQSSPIAFALLVPPGCIIQYIATTAPNGWLVCDGSAISRTTYAALYAIISTTYGSGNGSTTFNIPDFRGKVPVGYGTGSGLTSRSLAAEGGAETHTLTTSEMPSHNHSASDSGHTHTGTTDSNGSHTHTINDPGHYHSMGTETVQSGSGSIVANNDQGVPGPDPFVGETKTTGITINSSGAHTHTFTTNTGSANISIGNTGGGGAHNNMQPFLVVNYIIKY